MKILSCILAVAILFSSCEKNDSKINNEEGQVVFNISVKTSLLKSSSNDTSSSPKYLSVSIVDANGKSIYTLEKIELLKFNTEYISKPISMSPGKYKLTNFLVLDGSSNIIYACPLSGSAKAYLVKQPLSIDFEISKDIVTKVNPEVLSTKESKAADFGYLTSTFTTVKTFDFLISAFIYNESVKNFELTTASVNISNDTVNYNLTLDAKTNQLTVKDGYTNYKLTVSKIGYANKIINCTLAELKAYLTSPLKVVFDKTLIAYYPFNGNANDESGFGNNGIVNGACLANDRFGKSLSAYSLNGINNYIGLPNTFDFIPRTIDFWFFANDADYSNSYGAIYQSDNENLQKGNVGVAIKNIMGENLLLLTISATTDTISLNSNTWYNVALSIDENKNICFYLNGVLIGKKSFLSYLNSSSGEKKTIIGAGRYKNNNFFNGQVDDIRIFNRCLNYSEIKDLYNSN